MAGHGAGGRRGGRRGAWRRAIVGTGAGALPRDARRAPAHPIRARPTTDRVAALNQALAAKDASPSRATPAPGISCPSSRRSAWRRSPSCSSSRRRACSVRTRARPPRGRSTSTSRWPWATSPAPPRSNWPCTTGTRARSSTRSISRRLPRRRSRGRRAASRATCRRARWKCRASSTAATWSTRRGISWRAKPSPP